MAFQLSPGINVSEVDLTNAVPAVGTTEGAIAGVFRWGPTNERVLISSEQQLVDRFGAPAKIYNADFTDSWSNVETFYTASNFLGYSDALYVTRVETNGLASAGETAEQFDAKYAGELGNSIEISYCSGDLPASSDVQYTATNFSTGTLTLSDGTRDQASITGLTSVEADSLVKGTRLILRDNTSPVPNVLQEMVLAETPTVGDGGTLDTTNEKTFSPDEKPASATASGVVLQTEAVDQTDDSVDNVINVNLGVQGSIINFAAAHGFTKGQPIFYTTEGYGVIGGLEDNTTYFAIPVVASNGDVAAPATFTTGGTLDISGSALGLKLAATKADALAHTDSVGKNIQFTSRPGTIADNPSKLTPFSALTVDLQFTKRFTGPDVSEIYSANTQARWGDADLFDVAPSAGSIHIVVRDADGKITGTKGSILERFENLSTNPTAVTFDGSTNFVVDVLEQRSNWIKIDLGDATAFSSITSGTVMSGGADGNDEVDATLGEIAKGYDLYADPADVDVSLILQGKAKGSHALANYIIDNVAEVRRDCVAFVSPELADTTVDDILGFANSVTASSYAFIDSGYKYQYDKYNDVYTFIPLNGDVAGLCARTDDLRDPWFSPAGYQRGNVKNVVKLKVNPSKADRDRLYRAGVNPVITQPGQGTVLFGDKTNSGTASAFDRINVRRLFIVLEKTISQSAKSTLFEFNDEFTRAQFTNLVEPFLRDVQGRRGIYDFKVVCDESNNTSNVINNNQFVGDIYVKPARSINFIQLNFVAVRSGVEFNEIVGQG